MDILHQTPHLEYHFLDKIESPLRPETLQQYDALLSLSPDYTAASFKGVTRLKVICRFDAGDDMVDIDACNDANVVVTIPKGAVNYSVAEAIVTWMPALSHLLLAKNQLIRAGRRQDRNTFTGSELRRRSVGIIGFGGIGSLLVQMLRAFNLRQVLVYDPYISHVKATAIGV